MVSHRLEAAAIIADAAPARGDTMPAERFMVAVAALRQAGFAVVLLPAGSPSASQCILGGHYPD
jgi:polygalacturonase